MEVPSPARPKHHRQRSAHAILSSIVSPKARPAPPASSPANANSDAAHPRPVHGRPSARDVLGERQGNVQSPPASPSKKKVTLPINAGPSNTTKMPTKTKDGADAPKKSKSSTNLAAVFAKMNRSSKDLTTQLKKDKENTTPPVTSSGPPDTPIWAQYASQNSSNSSRPDSSHSKSSNNLRDEIARYTPKEYSPSKQRNFNGSFDQPSLRPTLTKSRPQSAYLAGESFIGAIGRRVSGGRGSSEEKRKPEDGRKKETRFQNGRVSAERPRLLQREAADRKTSGSSTEQAPAKEKLNITKRGGRVMAAVAAFQGKTKEPPQETKKEPPLDSKTVDEAFEAMLVSRNVGEAQRREMRALTLRVKADLVRQDKGTSPPGSLNNGLPKSTSSAKITETEPDNKKEEDESKATKRSRTRSRTFTFSKGDKKNKAEASPQKKQRSQSKSRPISIEIPKDAGFVSAQATPKSPTGSFGRKGASPAIPKDYIDYLRKNQDPTKAEVGRLHKLRILLRNETVAWVDSFISQDGMSEIVGLLNRTMAVEWREDHEDQLLHETLLCLKGICTTERALAELDKVADELFPSLLAMLFDDEKKGPAEYSTRTIIINVLFNFLAAATNTLSDELEKRARRILKYLAEPPKKLDALEPVDFVLGMRISRPYKLWCREVSNVTKEVFWIFLHQLNVVPQPKPTSSHSNHPSDEAERAKTLEATYSNRHFPGSRPPVPAAPYIGGVEWDATTYLTAHLDLLNGLIASIPSASARNSLRQELQASGFEKVMGTVLRTCKEKFYSGVHDGLRAWVAAAAEDGWETRFVREGPTDEEVKEHAMRARSASPKKNRKKDDEAPKLDAPGLDAPRLDLGLDLSKTNSNNDDDGWLG